MLSASIFQEDEYEDVEKFQVNANLESNVYGPGQNLVGDLNGFLLPDTVKVTNVEITISEILEYNGFQFLGPSDQKFIYSSQLRLPDTYYGDKYTIHEFDRPFAIPPSVNQLSRSFVSAEHAITLRHEIHVEISGESIVLVYPNDDEYSYAGDGAGVESLESVTSDAIPITVVRFNPNVA